jgi:ribosomal protein S18 acetylase RimI-like enzyme
VVTQPDHRRRGLASGVMHALADWGWSQGAEQVYLQVMNNNPPALQLYKNLGFEELYQYSYYELQ